MACRTRRSCFTATCTRCFPSGPWTPMGGHRADLYGRREVRRARRRICRVASAERPGSEAARWRPGGLRARGGRARYVGADTAALAWRVGPPNEPIIRGIDIVTIRDGRLSHVHTLIAADLTRDLSRLLAQAVPDPGESSDPIHGFQRTSGRLSMARLGPHC